MLYPLRFKPLLRQYLWGGRRLETVLGKSLGKGDDYAESWEIVDHGVDQSIVQFGALEGAKLGELVSRYGGELLGASHRYEQFPLLFKFLDANRDLSVQVHPNDEQGARLDPPDLGKTEAWVILDAHRGSKVYAGLKPGIDQKSFSDAIQNGQTESCLHQFEPEVGDCIFLPAGTVHALGAGLLVAEIQQASDTTYRLFDWNRVGADGRPRQLHVEEAMAVIDFDRGPVGPQLPATSEDKDISRLVECDKFVLDRWTFGDRKQITDGRCHLLAVLSGSVEVEHDPASSPLDLGDTMLVPASVSEFRLTPRKPAVMLDMYLP